MILTFIILWTITAILLINNPRQDYVKWGAAIAFSGGCGGFARAWLETFAPFSDQYFGTAISETHWGYLIYSICSFINQNGVPYAYLMFAIAYSGIGRRFRTYTALFAAIPPIIMLFTTPMFRELHQPYQSMIVWVAPYILFGSALILYSIKLETGPISRRNRQMVALLVLPPLLFQLIGNYVLPMFGIDYIWRLNSVVMTVLFIGFVAVMTKSSFLGIKIRFERQRLDSAMQAALSGTAILNHTIKNEVGKIRILAERITEHTGADGSPAVLEDAGIILKSSEHLLNMIAKIQEQFEDIRLEIKAVNVKRLLDDVLLLVAPLAERKGILFHLNVDSRLEMDCDQTHVAEALKNMVTNACEAMPGGGAISISCRNSENHIVISVKDTGCGISRELLAKVFDPFFTTKRKRGNYGLGLSYCFNVARKHGGRMEIHSDEGKGTAVSMSLPLTR